MFQWELHSSEREEGSRRELLSFPVPERPMTKEASKTPGKLRMVFSYCSLTAFGSQLVFGSLKRPRWYLDTTVLVIPWKEGSVSPFWLLMSCGVPVLMARCKCICHNYLKHDTKNIFKQQFAHSSLLSKEEVMLFFREWYRTAHGPRLKSEKPVYATGNPIAAARGCL